MRALQKELPQSHILIVDDNDVLREGLVYEFAKHGFRVSSADSGRKALALLVQDPADFVISDIRMPDGDGLELLTELKRQSPLIPFVLLVTGYSEITIDEARTRGADALLAKPFDRKALVEMVTNLLHKRGSGAFAKPVVGSQCALTFLARNTVVTGTINSISTKGMFVCSGCDILPDLNEPIHFNIELNGRSLIGNGIVTMVKIRSSEDFQSGCGIQFCFSGESAQQIMAEAILAQKIE